MIRTGRASFWAVSYFVVLAVVLAAPMTMHRRDFDRAFMANLHEPTPATEEALKREQLNNFRIELFVKAIAAGVFLSAGAGIAFGIKKVRGNTPAV